MDCAEILISVHAQRRFDGRGFMGSEIAGIVRNGEVIRSYEDDQPWPSYLVLGKIGDRFVHVVVAQNGETKVCLIVTAYEPDTESWNAERTQRKPQ